MTGRIKGLSPQPNPLRLKGRLYSYVTQDGRRIVAAWPKKRGTPKSPAQLASIERFKQAIAAIKLVSGEEYQAAKDATDGTPFLPRDALLAAYYGSLIRINVAGGPTLYSRRAMNQETQAALDSITTTTGALLVRTDDGWVALEPAQAGAVLTSFGPGHPPAYTDATGGIVPAVATTWPTPNNPDYNPANTRALGFFAQWDCLIPSTWGFMNADATKTYRARVYHAPAGTISALIADSGPINFPSDSGQFHVAKFPVPAALAKGELYFLTWSNITDPDATPWPFWGSLSIAGGTPNLYPGRWGFHAKANPATGDTFTYGDGFPYCIGHSVVW